ncbi:hypothetical protein BGX21_006498 [Mortierella sp. AD011]|nr:hypothetical protein BGX21_006498 [Mortierella sp. AD011]
MTVSQRLRSLIILYWVLIVSTTLEGVYFGIMVSNQKSKLVYCDYTGTVTGATTAPAAAKYSDSGSGSVPQSEVICHKMHTLLGAFYIVGPGAWVILHIGWILVVVLYSKALRMQNPVDEEMAVVRLHSQSTPNTRGPFLESPRKSNGVDLNDKSMQNIDIMSGNCLQQQQQHLFHKPGYPGLKLSSSSHVAISRTLKSPKDIDQGQSKSNSLQYIDADDIQSDHQNDLSDNDGEEVESSLGPEQAQSIGALDETKSSTTDVPLDGKGWWIRQIEGKRRGEMCPCTLNWKGSNEAESCWCGKERRVRYSEVHSARASTDWRARAGKDRSTSKSPVRSA